MTSALDPFLDETGPNGIVLRPIKKWPGYFAGSDGVIYSKKSGAFEMLAVWLGGRARCQYPKVTLYDGARRGNLYVHNLVALAWVGRRPRKTSQVRHKDGDRFNTAPTNLIYGTKRQNERDKIAAGTAPRGERHGAHRLTTFAATEILASSPDVPARELAALNNISVSQVQKIRAGTAWAHLPAPLSPGP